MALSIGSVADETLKIDYARRGLGGLDLGRGFDSRRLHHFLSSQSSVFKGVAIFVSAPTACWYSFHRQNNLGYPLDSISNAIFSGMAIDVHGQLGGSVSGEGLGFFDGDAAFDYQVDIRFADGVEVYLATRSLFRYPGRL